MLYYGVRRRQVQATQVVESREDGRKRRQKPLDPETKKNKKKKALGQNHKISETRGHE
jgi:hypothetical protein